MGHFVLIVVQLNLVKNGIVTKIKTVRGKKDIYMVALVTINKLEVDFDSISLDINYHNLVNLVQYLFCAHFLLYIIYFIF